MCLQSILRVPLDEIRNRAIIVDILEDPASPTLRRRLRWPLVAGSALITILLVRPETPQPMLLFLALPAAVATCILARTGISTARTRAAAVLFGLAFLFASLPSRAIVGVKAANLLSAACAGEIAALLLIGTMWLLVGLEEDE